jgi:SAM-dependent methyltransferase
MESNQRIAFWRLKNFILSTPYVDVYLTYGPLPCTSEGAWHQALARQHKDFPSPLSQLVSLFLIGKSCRESFLRKNFSDEEMGAFFCSGIIETDQTEPEFIKSKYVLMPYMGHLIFFERKRRGRDISVYLGEDSLALGAHLMPTRNGRCLDLCTGSGIQAILCASHAKQVIAVDLQGEAVKIASINACLNGLEDKLTVRRGDLFEPVNAEKFDFICANPPLLPAPKNLKSPMVAASGEDGLSLNIKILMGLPEHLEDGGVCQLIGTSLGDDSGPFLMDRLNTLKTVIGCSINAVFPVAVPINKIMNALAANSSLYCGERFERSRASYECVFKKMNATFLYPFFLRAIHQKGAITSVTHVAQYRTTKRGFWGVYF